MINPSQIDIATLSFAALAALVGFAVLFFFAAFLVFLLTQLIESASGLRKKLREGDRP